MKRMTAVLLTFVLLAVHVLPVCAAVEQADPSVKVHDFAGVLTPEEAAALEAQARTVVDKTHIDIAVVSVPDTGALTAEAYADDFYDYNGFGYGPNDDGLLMLVDMGGRKVHITTYAGGYDLFYDKDIDRLLDAATPFLKNGDYYGAFASFLSGSETHILSKTTFTAGDFLAALAAGLVAAGISVGLMLFFHRRSLRPAPGAQSYLDSPMHVTHKVDRFLHTRTSRTARPKNTGGGSGGGGHSSHSSSSGRSHGGGGRSF